jgi:hypothetical protein
LSFFGRYRIWRWTWIEAEGSRGVRGESHGES